MQSRTSQGLVLHFSTRGLAAPERIPFWREVFGRQTARLDVEPQSDRPIEAEATLVGLPGLRIGWCRYDGPAVWKRTASLVQDGDDALALLMPLSGSLRCSQRGWELEVAVGEGIGILQSEPASMRSAGHDYVVAMIPRAALSPLVGNVEDMSGRVVRPENGVVELLKGYLSVLRNAAGGQDRTALKLGTGHVHDLAALALGTIKDRKRVGRGVSAARLRVIKAELAANPSLSLPAVAAREGVTPRYVQLLFEAEGSTFTAYALDQRLARAWHMLTSPLCQDWSVSRIAFDAGFGDISHFNRTFRRRYGASPSEIRNVAAADRTRAPSTS